MRYDQNLLKQSHFRYQDNTMKNSNKAAYFIIIIWLILCAATAIAFYFDISELRWIDIPTHFAGGLMVAFLLNGKEKTPNLKKIFLLSLIVFLLWELFELSASTFAENEYIVSVFKETEKNRVQDVMMGILGFITFAKMIK